ncbi:MAG TPA: pyridoxal phosphate-dependent aminotransferase [Firmicutes bacterium]|jgi:aspartate aminotransferase|nr:pyridoxal phosphate-dependent aminotransferase [Bacillota bacterium]
MKHFLSARAGRINPSPTLAIDAVAKELKARGENVIGFGAGEPDFDTPAVIKELAIRALKEGRTKYTPASGITQLKEAVCHKYRREQGLEYRPEEVIVCCGAKHALYNVFQVICGPGDEVLLPSPYWVSYYEQIRLAGAEPVLLATGCDEGFKISPRLLAKGITPRTKVLVLNSPNNPTGAVYSREELAALAGVILSHEMLVISDEIYEEINYTGLPNTSIAALGPEIKNRTVIVNGLSKTFAMTGWRIGYALGDREIIQAMSALQSHSTSNPTTFCQVAATATLLDPPREAVQMMVAEFKKRRDYMVQRVKAMPGLDCLNPEGAFYVFVNMASLAGRRIAGRIIQNGDDLAQLFLEKIKVAVVPGSGFGAPSYFRLSYALGFEQIREGLDRIEELLTTNS